MHYLVVFLGAGIGGVCRYLMGPAIQKWLHFPLFPYGTFTINMIGCLVIGFLAQLAETKGLMQGDQRLFWMVGVLGGYTTFSGFGFETLQLILEGELVLAIANALGQVVLGVILVWLGYNAARFFPV